MRKPLAHVAEDQALAVGRGGTLGVAQAKRISTGAFRGGLSPTGVAHVLAALDQSDVVLADAALVTPSASATKRPCEVHGG